MSNGGIFGSALASSAPSAPSLGGSLSLGSHSGGADPEQAWPQSSGEEDLQLQLALAMSKEEAEQVRQSRAPEAHSYVLLQYLCWQRDVTDIIHYIHLDLLSPCNPPLTSPRLARTLWRTQSSAMHWHSAKRCTKRSGAESVPSWLSMQSAAIHVSVIWTFSNTSSIDQSRQKMNLSSYLSCHFLWWKLASDCSYTIAII